jgi:predicted dehydrogenase
MNERKIRIALIGYGYVGQTFHAPLIDSTAGLELAVVSSSKPDKVHERFPAATVATSPESAVTDSTVELVVIASPNTSHVPLATAALLAGKHVVVDKPFTITTDEARELEELAAEKKRLLSVFHDRRWDADFLTLKQLIATGKLGAINYFESRIDRYRPQVRDRWRERAGLGSGLWYDLGPHLIDQAMQFFGPPETVQATILRQRPGAQTDDYAHVVLGYGKASGDRADDLQVVLHASMLASGGSPRFLVHGSTTSWLKHGIDVQESQLVRGMRPGDAGWGIDPVEGLLYTGSQGPGSAPESVPNLPGSYEHFYAAIPAHRYHV